MSLPAILTSKESPYFPVLLVQFQFLDGSISYFSTHPFNTAEGGNQYNGHSYFARVDKQNIPQIQARSEQGVDQISDVTIDLDNADQSLLLTYEMGAGKGFKGAIMQLQLVMCDVTSSGYVFSNDSPAPFKFTGVCDAPQRAPGGAKTLSIRATTSHNMAMVNLPVELCQQRCINIMPATPAQRLAGGSDMSSPQWGCGYNPDQAGTDPEIGGDCRRGNTTTPNATDAYGNVVADGSGVFISCGYTKSDCVARGMYGKDSSNRLTGRFKGVQWSPPWAETQSNSYTAGKNVTVFAQANQGIFGKPYPLVYGTQWVNDPLIANWIGDGNSSRGEIIVANGDIGPNGIQQVVVNGILIPAYGAGVDKLERWNFLDNNTSGPYASQHTGSRNGFSNLDDEYNGDGDPYGGLPTIGIVVYQELAQSNSLPSVQVLVNGPRIAAYAPIATYNNGVITLPAGMVNNDIAGNPPFTVQISGCSLAGANGTWGLTSWSFGPPGTVTLTGGPSGTGTGGFIRYLSYGRVEGLTSPAGNTYSSSGQNPVWVLLDLLLWANYTYSELDIASFAEAAQFCDQAVSYIDLNGNSASHPRYIAQACFSQIEKANQLLQASLRSFNAQAVDNSDVGLKRIFIRRSLADQQPNPIPGSNYNTAVASIHADGSTGTGYVAYLIDESVILRDDSGDPLFEGPYCQPNAQAPNYIQFAFQDADNQWVQDNISVVDPEDVNRSAGYLLGGAQIPANYPISLISSFDQGQRVANTILAENYRGNINRDTRGSYMWQVTTTQRLEHLTVGQIVLLRLQSQQISPLVPLQSPPSTNITGVLCRVEAIAPQMNYRRMQVTLKYHEDYWYTDLWGQKAQVPQYSGTQKGGAGLPMPWRPYGQQPVIGDSIYGPSQWGFVVSQTYTPAADGSPIAQIVIGGCFPVNIFSPTLQPPQLGIQGATANTGGSIHGGGQVVGAISVQDSNGLWSPLSTLFTVGIPAGTNTNTAISPTVNWPSGASAWVLFAGRGHNSLSAQQVTGQTGLVGTGTPSTLTISALALNNFGPPDTLAYAILFEIAVVYHGGVWGDQCVAVSSNGDGTGKITFGVPCTAHQFQQVSSTVGYDLTLIALPLADMDPIPIADFHVIDNTIVSGQGVYHVSPDPVGLVIAGSIFEMRTFPSAVTSVTITEPNFANAYAAGGLATNAEVGRRLYIRVGTGAGQWRNITANTGTQITIDRAWDTVPDNTSRFAIVDSSFQPQPYSHQTASDFAPSPVPTIATINIQNYAQETILIRARTADQYGNTSISRWAPCQEVYVWGAQGTRLVTASATQLVTDGIVQFDTTNPTVPATTDTLAAAIPDITSGAITLASGAGTFNGTVVQVDSERLLVVDGAPGTALTVIRGWGGTTAATHSIGATVQVPGYIVFQLLLIAQVPNLDLTLTKISTDINFVQVLPGSGEELEDGNSVDILGDDSSLIGTLLLTAPGPNQ